VYAGNVVVLTESAGLMTIERLTDTAVSVLESVTLNVRAVPAAVGVPEMIPVEGASVNPVGRVPELRAQV
jgi:hypothetical protein